MMIANQIVPNNDAVNRKEFDHLKHDVEVMREQLDRLLHPNRETFHVPEKRSRD